MTDILGKDLFIRHFIYCIKVILNYFIMLTITTIPSWLNIKNMARLIIVVGILIRVSIYGLNSSFWMDESILASNVLKTPLFSTLSSDLNAPVGFLFISKLLSIIFGNSEYAFRLFPLVSGIVSLVLFYKFSNRCLSSLEALLATFLFSFSPTLIYFSTEFKQYSSDVTSALILWLIALEIMNDRDMSWKKTFIIAATCSVLIWFSHPSLFVFSGIIMVLLGSFFSKQNTLKLDQVSVIASLVAISTILLYLVHLSKLAHNNQLAYYFTHYDYSFPKIWPLNIKNILISKMILSRFFDFYGLNTLSILPFLTFFLIGYINFIKKNLPITLLLVLPIFTVVLISVLGLYPLQTRLVLFCCPSLFIITAHGCSWSISKAVKIVKGPKFTTSIVTVLLYLIFPGVLFYQYPSQFNIFKSDDREAVHYLNENIRKGDQIYLQSWVKVPYKYYFNRDTAITPSAIYSGSTHSFLKGMDLKSYPNLETKQVLTDINNIQNKKRVWIVLSNMITGQVRYYVLNNLNRYHATPLKVIHFKGASIHLYDFSESTLNEGLSS